MRTIKHPELHVRKLTKEQKQGLFALHAIFGFPHIRANDLRSVLYNRRATAPRKTHHHRAVGSKMLKRTNRLVWEQRYRPTENERLDGVH